MYSSPAFIGPIRFVLAAAALAAAALAQIPYGRVAVLTLAPPGKNVITFDALNGGAYTQITGLPPTIVDRTEAIELDPFYGTLLLLSSNWPQFPVQHELRRVTLSGGSVVTSIELMATWPGAYGAPGELEYTPSGCLHTMSLNFVGGTFVTEVRRISLGAPGVPPDVNQIGTLPAGPFNAFTVDGASNMYSSGSPVPPFLPSNVLQVPPGGGPGTVFDTPTFDVRALAFDPQAGGLLQTGAPLAAPFTNLRWGGSEYAIGPINAVTNQRAVFSNLVYDSFYGNAFIASFDGGTGLGLAQLWRFGATGVVPQAPAFLATVPSYFVVDMATHQFPTGFGCGCPTSLGAMPIASQTPAQLGTTWTASLAGAPPGAFVVLLIGSNNLTSALGTLPLGLAPFGAAGCTLLGSADVLSVPTFANGAGASSFSAALPNDPNLFGVTAWCQWAIADPPANAAGITASGSLMTVLY